MAIFFCPTHGAFTLADKLCECLKAQLVLDREQARKAFEDVAETCEGCGEDFAQLHKDLTGAKYCTDCFVEANAL